MLTWNILKIKPNRSFGKKIESNIGRDKHVTNMLKDLEGIVTRFWGKKIMKDMNKYIARIEITISERHS